MTEAGSGKSILCSSIIEESKALREAGLGLVAYYYFDLAGCPWLAILPRLSALRQVRSLLRRPF